MKVSSPQRTPTILQMNFMQRSTGWLLRVRLNGDWEQCRFSDPADALATLEALAKDYASLISHAVIRPLGPRTRTPVKKSVLQ